MPKSSIARGVVIGLCTISSLTEGQIVRGTVIQPNGVAPVRTVVVTAVDSLGRERSRVLVDSLGRFRLALDAGTWRIRSRQIGYRMEESPGFVLRPGEERTLELSAPFRAIALPTVQIVEAKACASDARSASTLDALWEQVEASVQVAGAVAEDTTVRAQWAKYTQTGASDDLLRRLVHLEFNSGASRRVFTSVDERVLAKEGFVTQAVDGVVVRAPDADLLLTPWFRSTHCFRVKKSENKLRPQIGLSFAPIHRQWDRVDVTGTLWLSTPALRLERIEFEYVGLPLASIGRVPGGSVVFGSLPDSTLFVHEWEVVFPMQFEAPRMAESSELERGRVSVTGRRQLRVPDWHYEGGSVYGWTRGGKALFADERQRRVFAVKNLDSAANAVAFGIGIADVPMQTVKAGEMVTFGFVPNGMLPVVRQEHLFDDVWRTDTSAIELGDDRSPIQLEYPSIATEIFQRCGHRRPNDKHFDLLLKFETAIGRVSVKREVRVDWQDGFLIQRNGSTVSARDQVLVARLNAYGFAVGCDLPRETKLRITLVEGDLESSHGYVRAETAATVIVWRPSTPQRPH